MLRAKLSPLYQDNKPWMKKDSKGLFDVTMGSFDGAWTAELIGQYMLHRLQHLNINIGLYRDDGLGVSHLKLRLLEQNLYAALCIKVDSDRMRLP